MSDTAAHDDSHGHGHDPHLAHHFYTHKQQLDSFKLGMWLFITTEILFFSGLFCAYAVYRSIHPEYFIYGDDFLNKWLGALNTGVLIFSSLTAAWAVRCAQLGDNRSVQILLIITMMCAAIFLGVKAVEYSHKWDEGLLPGKMFSYVAGEHHEEAGLSKYLIYLSIPPIIGLIVSAGLLTVAVFVKEKWAQVLCFGLVLTFAGYFVGVAIGKAVPNEPPKHAAHDEHKDHDHGSGDHGSGDHAAGAGDHSGEHGEEGEHGQSGTGESGAAESGAGEGSETAEAESPENSPAAENSEDNVAINELGAMAVGKPLPSGGIVVEGEHSEPVVQPEHAGIFFSIYYCMTGLHAIHIIGGIIALAWLLAKAGANHFTPSYFGPVDCVGLYWHLVDLIWIYLFPLLYLIA